MAFKKKEDKPKANAPKSQTSAKAKAPVVLVWNAPRVRLVQVPVEANGRKVSKSIRLNPGANTISASAWEELQKRSKIQSQLKKGALRLVVDQEREPLQKVPRTLDKVPEDEATVLVENTMDESQLQAWAKGETRDTVVKAIATQLEALASVVSSKDDE